MSWRTSSRQTESSPESSSRFSPGSTGNSHRWWPSGVGQSTAGRSGSQWMIDEIDRPAAQHVALQTFREPDLLPDPHDLLIGGDRPGAGVGRGIALEDDDIEPEGAEEVRRRGTDRAVADDRDVGPDE